MSGFRGLRQYERRSHVFSHDSARPVHRQTDEREIRPFAIVRRSSLTMSLRRKPSTPFWRRREHGMGEQHVHRTNIHTAFWPHQHRNLEPHAVKKIVFELFDFHSLLS